MIDAELTEQEVRIMEHATGWNHKNRLFRNHFAADSDSDCWAALQSLCERGLMHVSFEPSALFGSMTVFAVTKVGIDRLKAREPVEPKLNLGDLFATDSKSEPWNGYDFSKKSLAVLASDQKGYGIVLWTVGGHVRMELEEGNLHYLDDLGIQPPGGAGIWIWEGKYSWDSDGYSEPRGEHRRPTEDEWAAIREGRCPWNDEDWKLEEQP